METIDTSSYEELQLRIKDLVRAERSKGHGMPSKCSQLLFRGQSDASWHLETTLERFFADPVSPSDYRHMIHQLRISIETAMDVTIPLDPEFREDSRHAPADYPMMVYARHHGFPSPLLDWTESPHIALFFAMASSPAAGEGKSAVYVFREDCGVGKVSALALPRIVGLGPSIRTHPRHFKQKAWYTICRSDDPRSGPVYESHQDVFMRDDPHQDKLWKFTIPWSEKLKALEELDDMNINAFTLFGSEEHLMSTVAHRILRESLGNSTET